MKEGLDAYSRIRARARTPGSKARRAGEAQARRVCRPCQFEPPGDNAARRLGLSIRTGRTGAPILSRRAITTAAGRPILPARSRNASWYLRSPEVLSNQAL